MSLNTALYSLNMWEHFLTTTNWKTEFPLLENWLPMDVTLGDSLTSQGSVIMHYHCCDFHPDLFLYHILSAKHYLHLRAKSEAQTNPKGYLQLLEG
jgi:hypothetical protein